MHGGKHSVGRAFAELDDNVEVACEIIRHRITALCHSSRPGPHCGMNPPKAR
jgi:hypothetical protein